jgi:ubiquinone/menaquinone biosynthesis C-methylase UbiE
MNADPRHASLNERKWDARAVTIDRRQFDYFRWMQRRVIGLIDLKQGCHFLDVGCGTGWAIRHVASRLQDEGEFYGIDLSSVMIETARAQSRDFANVHFEKANAEQIPLASDSIDYAICTNSFHHYLNPSHVLAEIHRVLVAGGRVYILDMTTDDFLMRWVDRRVRRKEP